MRAVLIGVLIALLGIGHPYRVPLNFRADSLGCARYWVADRTQGCLMLLTAELFVRAVLDLPYPFAMAAWGDQLWVAAAPRGRSGGPHQVCRVDAVGALLQRATFSRVVDLKVGDDGAAILIAGRADEERVLRLGPEGGSRMLLPAPGALHLAVRESVIVIGTRDQELLRWDPRDAVRPLQVLQVPAPILGVATGPRGGWWLLQKGGQLVLLDDKLQSLWSRDTGLSEGVLVATQERAWVLSRVSGEVRAFGREGRSLASSSLPVAGFEGGIPAGRAGLLALGAGAALLLDDGGRLQTFQGAFWHLSSAAALTTEQECGQQGL